MANGLDFAAGVTRVARDGLQGAVIEGEEPVVYAIPADERTDLDVSLEDALTAETDDVIYVIGESARRVASAFDDQPDSLFVDGVLVDEPFVEPALDALLGSLLANGMGNRLCYTTPGTVVDADRPTDQHRDVVDAAISSLGFDATSVSTGYAVVADQLQEENVTGLGINVGRDVTSVALVYYGVPVIAFSLAKGRDWIVERAADSTGHTAVQIRSRLEDFTLDPDAAADDIESALAQAYDELTGALVDALRVEATAAELERGVSVPVAVAGPWAVAGVEFLLGGRFDAAQLPFSIRGIRRADDPEESAVRGALVAAQEDVDEFESVTWSAHRAEDPDSPATTVDVPTGGDGETAQLTFDATADSVTDGESIADDAIEQLFDRLGTRDDELADLRDRLETLTSDLEDLEARAATEHSLEGVESDLESVRSSVESIESTVEDRLDAVERTHVDDVESMESALAEQQDALADAVDDLETGIADVEESLAAELDETTESLTNDVERLDDELAASSESLRDDLDALQSTISPLETSIDEFEPTVSALETTVAELESDVATLESAVDEVEPTVSTMESTLSEIEPTVSELDSSIESFETTLSDVESTVSELEAAQSSLETDVDERIEANRTSIDDELAAIRESIDELRTEYEAIDDELESTTEPSTDPDETVAAVRSEYDDRIETVEESISSLEAALSELESATTVEDGRPVPEAVSSLRESIESLEASLETRLDSLEQTKLGTASASQLTIEDVVDADEVVTDEILDEAVSELNAEREATIESLRSTVDELESDIESIRETATDAASSTPEEGTPDRIASLDESVADMDDRLGSLEAAIESRQSADELSAPVESALSAHEQEREALEARIEELEFADSGSVPSEPLERIADLDQRVHDLSREMEGLDPVDASAESDDRAGDSSGPLRTTFGTVLAGAGSAGVVAGGTVVAGGMGVLEDPIVLGFGAIAVGIVLVIAALVVQ